MTAQNDKHRAPSDRLSNCVTVDDIFNMSDEELLTRIREELGNPSQVALEMRALFEKTAASMNKQRRAAAELGHDGDATAARSANVIPMYPGSCPMRVGTSSLFSVGVYPLTRAVARLVVVAAAIIALVVGLGAVKMERLPAQQMQITSEPSGMGATSPASAQ